IWRGLKLSESAAIQPSISFTKDNFLLGSWASYTIARESVQEIDWFFVYKLGQLSFILNNYYTLPDTGSGYSYFNINPSSTLHAFEGGISFQLSKSFPLTLFAATMFYGNDRDINGNLMFSTYLEANYIVNISKIDFGIFLGLTPYKGYYANDFAIINLGFSATKTIALTTEYSIKTKGSYVLNFAQKSVFLLFTITL
ncbi:MAG: hypothetical protein N2662_00905, partial [Bacteroidales bacterium]|nr:hypothetical protein [Bacteroidales bacterium]